MPFKLEYRVAGKGVFPKDMLRYVPSVPRTEDDKISIDATDIDWPGPREIELVREATNMTAVNFLAEPRWKSFGWTVMRRGKPFYYATKGAIEAKRARPRRLPVALGPLVMRRPKATCLKCSGLGFVGRYMPRACPVCLGSGEVEALE